MTEQIIGDRAIITLEGWRMKFPVARHVIQIIRALQRLLGSGGATTQLTAMPIYLDYVIVICYCDWQL